jgi:hypothetical protein
MEFLDVPEDMTPEQRLAEVAAILAEGYLRSRGTRPFTEKPLDCSGAPLPLCDEGLTEREPTPVEVAQ